MSSHVTPYQDYSSQLSPLTQQWEFNTCYEYDTLCCIHHFFNFSSFLSQACDAFLVAVGIRYKLNQIYFWTMCCFSPDKKNPGSRQKGPGSATLYYYAPSLFTIAIGTYCVTESMAPTTAEMIFWDQRGFTLRLTGIHFEVNGDSPWG